MWELEKKYKREMRDCYLHCHCDICGFVEDLFHCAIVAFSKLLVESKLIHVDSKGSTARKIDAGCMEDGLAVEVEGTRGIAMMIFSCLVEGGREKKKDGHNL